MSLLFTTVTGGCVHVRMSLASGTFHIIKAALFTSSWFVQVTWFVNWTGVFLSFLPFSPDCRHLLSLTWCNSPVPVCPAPSLPYKTTLFLLLLFGCWPYVPSPYTQYSSFRSNLGEHELFLSGLGLIPRFFFFLQTSNRLLYLNPNDTLREANVPVCVCADANICVSDVVSLDVDLSSSRKTCRKTSFHISWKDKF